MLAVRLYLVFALLCLFSCRQASHAPAPPLPSVATGSVESAMINGLPADTSSVTALLKQAKLVVRRSPDSAIYLCNEALALSKQLSYDQGAARSLLEAGSCLFNYKRQYKDARQRYLQAVPYCFAAHNKDPMLVPAIYNSLGSAYAMENDYDSSIQYYYRSLAALKVMKAPDSALLITVCANIGGVLTEVGSKEQALYYLQQADTLAGSRKDTAVLAQNCQNLGKVYQNSADTCAAYLQRSAALYRSLGNAPMVQQNYTNLGVLWVQNNHLEKARIYFDSAIAAYPQGVVTNHSLLQGLGGVNYTLGDYKAAIAYYERSLQICIAEGQRHDELFAYWTLAEMYYKLGNTAKAYQYQRHHSLLMDSLMSETITGSISQQEVKYRTAEQGKELVQKQLLITQQQNKIQKQYLWLAGALVFILALFGVLRIRRHKAALAELQAKLAGEEQERIRLARELHDGIVSKLSSVKMNFNALPLHTDTEEAEQFRNTLHQLEESISELRSTSHNLHPAALQRAGLEAAVRLYCAKIKTTTALDIEFQVLGVLPPLKADAQLNLYRIVQELIQNIIKHSGAANALVQFAIRDGLLNITIDDDGIGMPAEKMQNENSTGLYNLHNRARLLNGTMKIETGKGTSVYLEFPLKYLAEK